MDLNQYQILWDKVTGDDEPVVQALRKFNGRRNFNQLRRFRAAFKTAVARGWLVKIQG